MPLLMLMFAVGESHAAEMTYRALDATPGWTCGENTFGTLYCQRPTELMTIPATERRLFCDAAGENPCAVFFETEVIDDTHLQNLTIAWLYEARRLTKTQAVEWTQIDEVTVGLFQGGHEALLTVDIESQTPMLQLILADPSVITSGRLDELVFGTKALPIDDSYPCGVDPIEVLAPDLYVYLELRREYRKGVALAVTAAVGETPDAVVKDTHGKTVGYVYVEGGVDDQQQAALNAEVARRAERAAATKRKIQASDAYACYCEERGYPPLHDETWKALLKELKARSKP